MYGLDTLRDARTVDIREAVGEIVENARVAVKPAKGSTNRCFYTKNH